MTLVVFLRGVNVGGHRRFRPSLLARELRQYDVVNVGAAGTFVVREPGTPAAFTDVLARKLPFDTRIVVRDGRDVLRLESDHPFGSAAPGAGITRFVSILPRTRRRLDQMLPVVLPPDGDWLVRVVESRNGFVFGMYRRHMKTIGYLGQIDKLFGAPATVRNWNTIAAIVRILRG